MAKSVKEIMKQIEEKNKILSALSLGKRPDQEKIKREKLELDKLLYTYLKSLKFNGLFEH